MDDDGEGLAREEVAFVKGCLEMLLTALAIALVVVAALVAAAMWGR